MSPKTAAGGFTGSNRWGSNVHPQLMRYPAQDRGDLYKHRALRIGKIVTLAGTQTTWSPNSYSAAIRTSGAAARTSASTVFSYLTKFSWNMRTSLRAVSSKADLSFQVFIG